MSDIVQQTDHCRICRGSGTRGGGLDKIECWSCRGSGCQTVRIDPRPFKLGEQHER